VEFGKELTRFEQHDDHVVAYLTSADSEEVVQCQWLLGADGARSIVRKRLGIPFLGTTQEELQMLTGDVFIHGGLSEDNKVYNSFQYPGHIYMYYFRLRTCGETRKICTILCSVRGSCDPIHLVTG
jgi:2-polyprenyl-6-methoxyphenol hydroxylase-like FAD-dependent oxidoreductase